MPRALERIASQIVQDKTEAEVGLFKPATSKGDTDLFLRLLQTSITRFGLLAVIGFFVTILVSLYRYNIRLAAFYMARADSLRMYGEPLSVSDFVSIATDLTPTVEFGKAPQAPISQLVELVKTAKETAK